MVTPNKLYLCLLNTNFLILTNLAKLIKLRILLPTQDCLCVTVFIYKWKSYSVSIVEFSFPEFTTRKKIIICWKEHEMELKPRSVLRDSHMIKEIYALDTALDSIKEVEDCQSKILNADYSATDVDKIWNCVQLLFVKLFSYIWPHQRSFKFNLFSLMSWSLEHHWTPSFI